METLISVSFTIVKTGIVVRKVLGSARLSKKYQIVVPKVVRVLLDLGEGDTVQFILDGDRIYIEKAGGGE